VSATNILTKSVVNCPNSQSSCGRQCGCACTWQRRMPPAPSTGPHLSSRAMAQTATGAEAPKEPPDASPAQAPTHARPRTAGRHRVAQLPTRSPGQCLHAYVSLQRGTRLTHAARPRRQAPPPRTHAGAQAPAAHPRRTRAPRSQERPEHTCPGTTGFDSSWLPFLAPSLPRSRRRMRVWRFVFALAFRALSVGADQVRCGRLPSFIGCSSRSRGSLTRLPACRPCRTRATARRGRRPAGAPGTRNP